MTSARQPVSGPDVWLGTDYAQNQEWVYHFSDAAIADIDRAMRSVRQRDRVLDDITAEDFDLPALAHDLNQMGQILSSGRGFVLLKGLDIDKYSSEEFAIIFWGIGTHLGVGVSQSHLGDRIGHVKDIGGKGRYYTAGGPIEVHMDPADVTGLLCLREAKRGGESWIMSSMMIRNILLDERPDLLEVLYQGYHYGGPGTGPGGNRTAHRLPVYAEKEGECYSFYLPAAIVGRGSGSTEELSDAEREAMTLLDEIAVRPQVRLEMDLRPGDIQFLNNRKLFHARGDYEDHPDPAKKRHLLRLWLMMPHWPPLPESMKFLNKADRAGGGVPKGDESVTELVGSAG